MLVATTSDDAVNAPQLARYVAREIPGAKLYESRQVAVDDLHVLHFAQHVTYVLEEGLISR